MKTEPKPAQVAAGLHELKSLGANVATSNLCEVAVGLLLARKSALYPFEPGGWMYCSYCHEVQDREETVHVSNQLCAVDSFEKLIMEFESRTFTRLDCLADEDDV